jgi:hypothetical protein
MVTRRMKVRDRLSDDGGEGLRRGEKRGEKVGDW